MRQYFSALTEHSLLTHLMPSANSGCLLGMHRLLAPIRGLPSTSLNIPLVTFRMFTSQSFAPQNGASIAHLFFKASQNSSQLVALTIFSCCFARASFNISSWISFNTSVTDFKIAFYFKNKYRLRKYYQVEHQKISQGYQSYKKYDI